MAKQLIKEKEEEELKEAEKREKELLLKERAQQIKSAKDELAAKREAKLAKILGEHETQNKKKSMKPRPGTSSVAAFKPKSFTDKMDQWLNRIDKKLEEEVVLERAKVHDYLEDQKEVKETLKLFEESLKYHKENHEYKKKMS